MYGSEEWKLRLHSVTLANVGRDWLFFAAAVSHFFFFLSFPAFVFDAAVVVSCFASLYS